MTKRVLIAGCGDVGLRVAQRLMARGERVLGLRRHVPQAAGVPMLAADLSDVDSLRALPDDIDQVVYLPTPGAREPAAYRAVFVDGLGHLLDALSAQRVRRWVWVSSSAVYGDHAGGWVDETTPTAPPGFNGQVLLEGERLLAERLGQRAVVLRLAGLYGPGRAGLIERIAQGRAKAVREPAHWANRMHVDDAAAAIVHLLDLADPHALYLGVDDTPLPIDVLYARIAQCLGVAVPAEGPAPAGVGSKRLSNARLRASGFVPRWPDAREGYAAQIKAMRATAG
ncbi:NAD-dependent epimerase/dehydratase family protein [Oleiagrimonas sp. C23AA]|uniref:NAD-dependent epimerase/dehydratase family protein n=1 Tax=Oleiagrimonas sp. C23AA TaxID=2719047 RepID=UPI00141F8D85|nr:NAD-dependent epimerase/dehydratase family protein [Oleiagrimonas sp. C23AA]NII12006.1 NAD-dependent epimerase/dehydratase family protein [Oleiagrimonas sp. C23AA]